MTPDDGLAAFFGHLSHHVIDAIRGLRSRATDSVAAEDRDATLAVIENGLRDGSGPAAMAMRLREPGELSPANVVSLANYRDALERKNGRRLKDYSLRDRRLDRMFARGTTLSAEQVDRYAEKYRLRLVALDAYRLARTLAGNAYGLANRLAWQQASERGIVDRSRLMHRWIVVGDSRTRRRHTKMHGEVVQFDQRYSNGELVPGESTYCCRCTESFFVAPRP